MKKYIEHNNLKNKHKNVYDSINKYLNIWEKINETLFIFTDKQKKNKNNEINRFLMNENSRYTPSQIRFPSNNNNNKVG
jgi:hypothetical protein